MTETRWFAYTDGSGKTWRLRTTPELAEIGGLPSADSKVLEPLPPTLKPRYAWFHEVERPTDRQPLRQKVIIAKDYLQFLIGVKLEYKGKNIRLRSYYGEVVSIR